MRDERGHSPQLIRCEGKGAAKTLLQDVEMTDPVNHDEDEMTKRDIAMSLALLQLFKTRTAKTLLSGVWVTMMGQLFDEINSLHFRRMSAQHE